MHISKRLKTIASFIDANDEMVYDVGCDHALLDIYLASKYKNINFLTIDISFNCIQKAKENIQKYGLEKQISSQVNDGLNNIKLNVNSTLVISGMGAHTIIDILNKSDITKFKKIIIQSNNDIELLRREMIKKQFIIEREEVVFDKKYYIIIEFVPGITKYSCTEYLFGPKLLIDIDKNKDYFKFLYQKNMEIYNKLPLFNVKRRLKIILNLIIIKKLLKK